MISKHRESGTNSQTDIQTEAKREQDKWIDNRNRKRKENSIQTEETITLLWETVKAVKIITVISERG